VYLEVSEPTRYRIVQELSTGVLLTASKLSPLLHQDQRQVSKHLRALRECGLVFEQPGVDRRFNFNGIHRKFLRGLQDGVYIVDFGSGVLRIPAPAPLKANS
ncbi:MAG: transcriptional regulator, partial [Verrucomicrobiaceae bacterium]